MAGFSILLLLGPFLAIGAAVGFAFSVYMVYSYIFESIFCASVCKNRWGWRPVLGWIPFWGQYLLGRVTGSWKLGLLLELDHLIVLLLCCVSASEYVELISILFLLFIVLGMALKAILVHRIYKMAAPKYYKVFSWAGILTLGLLRPIFLFALRKKVCMFSKTT